MTTEAIKALVDLEDKSKALLHELDLWQDSIHPMPLPQHLLEDAVLVLKADLAAIEALKPMADVVEKGGCKMAWKQGFCYGDPDYYPPPAASPAPSDEGGVESLKTELGVVIDRAQEWCDAVDRGTSWDYWDHHFKEMKYTILPQARAALAAIKEGE